MISDAVYPSGGTPHPRLYAAFPKVLIDYVRREPEMKITLAQGLAVGLEFKLCSEILKTVIVREWKEILTVAGIIGLRAALTFLIHWEIKEGVREEHGKKKENSSGKQCG